MKHYSTPYVSVIIITYDPTAAHVQKTLNTLLRQSYKDFEVLVVDSGEQRLSSEILANTLDTTSIPHRSIPLHVKKGARFNYARAYNIGIKKAKGEIIVRLSGDAIPVGKHWLKHCVDLIHQEDVGIISGIDVIKNDLSLDTYLLSAIYDRTRQIAIQSKKRNKHKNLPLVNGPCMIFYRKIWSKHKFNEEWLWGEELEFTTWAMRKGYYLIYDPKIRILHSHRLSTKNALHRIGSDLLFVLKANNIFQERVLSLIQDQLRTTIEVPFAQIEKGRQYYIKNGSVKVLHAYMKRISSLKKIIDQFVS